jgi:hypothetical protein
MANEKARIGTTGANPGYILGGPFASGRAGHPKCASAPHNFLFNREGLAMVGPTGELQDFLCRHFGPEKRVQDVDHFPRLESRRAGVVLTCNN